jgi:hypothetical protein
LIVWCYNIPNGSLRDSNHSNPRIGNPYQPTSRFGVGRWTGHLVHLPCWTTGLIISTMCGDGTFF